MGFVAWEGHRERGHPPFLWAAGLPDHLSAFEVGFAAALRDAGAMADGYPRYSVSKLFYFNMIRG
jgi:hypothetical protein